MPRKRMCMKLVANCISQPSAVRSKVGSAMMPALLTRICRGSCQLLAKLLIDAWSLRSRPATRTFRCPAAARISAATACPASGLRTASVTTAPASASARAVSTPMPDVAPVTMACLPIRSTPLRTWSAVELKPNGVLIFSIGTLFHFASIAAIGA